VQNDPRPEGLRGAAGWRSNFVDLAPDVAASPLPTRQLRRMAGRQVAKQLSVVQALDARRQHKLTRKRLRALAAAEKHKHDGSGTAE
jgi:hypothetical protein